MINNGSHKPANSQWVLIVTDNASFGRDLTTHWQTQHEVPEFTTVSSEGSEFIGIEKFPPLDGYDLAVTGKIPKEHLHSVLHRTRHVPAVLVWTPPGVAPSDLREEFPNTLPLRECASMVESTVAVGVALLLRTEYQKRVACTEGLAGDDKIHAALGRYMVESRPNLNNALTSILGTAELMELGNFRSGERVREDVKTIHMMALRIQSMLQHFSVVEAELKLKESKVKAGPKLLDYALLADPQGPMQ